MIYIILYIIALVGVSYFFIGVRKSESEFLELEKDLAKYFKKESEK
jgi:hypothetical protein